MRILKKGMALALVTVMAMTMVTGCGNSSTESSNDAATSAGVSGDDLTGAVGTKVTEYEGYLGYGYHVMCGDYFNEEGVDASNCVIDMDSLAAAGYVREAKMNKTSLNYYSATSITDFYASFKEKFAGMADMGFTGIMSAYKMNSEEFAYKDQYLIYSNCEVKTQRQLINGATAKLLSGYLTDGFKEDVEKLSAKELMKKYGTYVLTDIQVGGRMSLLFYLKQIGDFTYDELSAAVAYYYEQKGIKAEENDIDVDAYASEKLKLATTYIKQNAQVAIRTYGGDVNLNPTKIDKALDSYADWQKSVKDGATAFIDATSGIPIWELAATVNADKGKEIENAFNGYEEDTTAAVSGSAVKK